jgi:malonyl-CoA O-methyltransferase
MIEKAWARTDSPNVTFEIADITKRWPSDDQACDLVVCNLVLEHIEDLGFIFAEGARVLSTGGRFFVCELHPFRQYQGTQAHFEREGATAQIPAFLHHITDFITAAQAQRLSLLTIKEWWHEEDAGKSPRLISFMFGKQT